MSVTRNRRKFLAVLGIGGAAAATAAATVVRTPAPASRPAAAAGDARGTGGYRVTEHVLKYYRSTRV
ncbi:MAG TPA: formate dehydrogenase [Burkholderiales bacterium]|nr:formate dehydrogenase [Burkholderiales bacterium]